MNLTRDEIRLIAVVVLIFAAGTLVKRYRGQQRHRIAPSENATPSRGDQASRSARENARSAPDAASGRK